MDTGWKSRIRFPAGAVMGFFSLRHRVQTVLGPTQPPIQWVAGTLTAGIRRPEREADNSPPSNVEVKNTWNYTSTPQYVFMAWCLAKEKNNFTLLYSTLLYSTLPYPTLLYPTLPYSTPLHSTPLHSTLLHPTLLYSTPLYSTIIPSQSNSFYFTTVCFCKSLFRIEIPTNSVFLIVELFRCEQNSVFLHYFHSACISEYIIAGSFMPLCPSVNHIFNLQNHSIDLVSIRGSALKFERRVQFWSVSVFYKLYQQMSLYLNVYRWATGWMIGCSSPGRGWEYFSSPRPDRFWGPPSLLSNAYQGLFPWR
jgi:hypothetical protein